VDGDIGKKETGAKVADAAVEHFDHIDLLRLVGLVQRPGRQQLVRPGGHDAPAGPRDARAADYDSVADLAEALRRAAAAHGKHEEEIGQADPEWPDWYAQYMVDERNAQAAGA
jgi:hypothetical protein